MLAGADVLKLTTLRSHDQYNTTVYGLDDRYRGVFGRRDVLFISERDLVAQHLEHGDLVEIISAIPGQEHKRIRLTAIAHDIAPGSIGAYYPEANNLCPLTYQDPQSGTPSYKSLPVRLRKVAYRPKGLILPRDKHRAAGKRQEKTLVRSRIADVQFRAPSQTFRRCSVVPETGHSFMDRVFWSSSCT